MFDNKQPVNYTAAHVLHPNLPEEILAYRTRIEPPQVTLGERISMRVQRAR
jgi:hypothetical protein